MDVHINEWFSYKQQSYIDVGVRIYRADNTKYLKFFFPLEIKENDLFDLYDYMSNEKISSDIFNTVCTVHKSNVSESTDIEYNDRKESIIQLKNYVVVSRIDDEAIIGSIVSINISSIIKVSTNNELYIRFRLPHTTVDDLFLSDFKMSYFLSCLASPESEFKYFMLIDSMMFVVCL